MTVKPMVIATAALMGLAAAIAPASATTITHVHGGSVTAIGNGFTVDSTATVIGGTARVTLINDTRRAAPASFAPAPIIANNLIDRDAIALQARTASSAHTAVSDASILPEATTWAMMLIGFAMIGLGMRHGIRRSNAKFDLKVQRIAAGLEA